MHIMLHNFSKVLHYGFIHSAAICKVKLYFFKFNLSKICFKAFQVGACHKYGLGDVIFITQNYHSHSHDHDDDHPHIHYHRHLNPKN